MARCVSVYTGLRDVAILGTVRRGAGSLVLIMTKAVEVAYVYGRVYGVEWWSGGPIRNPNVQSVLTVEEQGDRCRENDKYVR